jgi:sec-independent protein translocase protein TatC
MNAPRQTFDPERHRMAIGDHLEELRRRFVYGLLGLAVIAIACLWYGKSLESYFCQPLTDALYDADVNPQIFYQGVGDPFMVYMQISLICAAVIAGPWMIYQLWLFVAAGLFPSERKYVTRYVPLSIALLIMGMAFVYLLVLPWTLQFFIGFGSEIPLHPRGGAAPMVVTTQPLPRVPSFQGDPAKADDGTWWYNSVERRLKMMVSGRARVIPFGPEKLLAPHITLPDYIDLVVGMLLTFALAFQLPLVVLALLRLGIVELAAMRAMRKYVYFAMTVIAAMITPGDVITATIALVVPLCLLFELGIALFLLGNRRAAREQASG